MKIINTIGTLNVGTNQTNRNMASRGRVIVKREM
jgi:hypothetical protein